MAAVKTYEGIISEVGDSTSRAYSNGSITNYSYIEIGDQIIKKATVISGVDSKMMLAFKDGESVILYVAHGCIFGVKNQVTGKTFLTDFHANGTLYMIAMIISVCLMPFGIGFLIWAYGYFGMGWAVRLQRCSDNLPSAIPL